LFDKCRGQWLCSAYANLNPGLGIACSTVVEVKGMRSPECSSSLPIRQKTSHHTTLAVIMLRFIVPFIELTGWWR